MIYFLRRADGLIRVGTTANYHERLATHKAQYGELELLGLMDGNREVEQQLHKQFAAYRQRRTEWFRFSPALQDFIIANTHLNIPERPPGKKTLNMKKDTRIQLREFANGLGVTHEAALIFLLKKSIGETNPHIAGFRLRKEFKERYKD